MDIIQAGAGIIFFGSLLFGGVYVWICLLRIVFKTRFLHIPILLLLLSLIIFCYIHRMELIMNWYSVFIPEDYFEPLCKMEIDVSKAGKYKTEFKHKYYGNHEIILSIEGEPFVSSDQIGKVDFRLNLKFIFDDKTVSIDVDCNTDLEIKKYVEEGERKRKYRDIDIFMYETPKDLPMNKIIELEIEIVRLDEDFTRLYGKQKLSLKKTLDAFY
jgi:hypothetical protein